MSNSHNKNGPDLAAVKKENILFLDVETIPMAADFSELPEVFKPLWIEKSRKYSYENMPPEELFFEKAGIHAEFGKVICISVGFFHTHKETGRLSFRIKSFYGHNEKEILISFKEMLDLHFNDYNKHYLVAHNGVEFDFPFLSRRMLVNRIPLPALLNVAGTKSWNNRWLIDTMELWRFGDYKEKTSLNLLAACFGIDSPKDDISGKDVARVYYHENNLERIRIYCQKDVATLARIFNHFAGLSQILEDDVVVL